MPIFIKIQSSVFCLSFIVFIAAFLSNTATATNYINNPSFEEGGKKPSGWKIGGKAKRSSDKKKSGKSSLEVNGPFGNFKQTIDLIPNTDYELSFQVLASGIKAKSIHIDTLDKFDQGQNPGGTCQFNINKGDARSWTRYSGRFNSYHEKTVTIRSYGKMKGTVYFDDFSLKAIGPLGKAVAKDDFIVINPGDEVMINALRNDYGDSLSPKTVRIIRAPSMGLVNIENGNFIYRHNGSTAGTDELVYTVSNVYGTESNKATVQIKISDAKRIDNSTINFPDKPPVMGYTGEAAFPGLKWKGPMWLRTPPGETDRLFVGERAGVIWVVSGIGSGELKKTKFMDISDKISIKGEGGLLSMAFHPNFNNSGQEGYGQFFLYYFVGGGPIYGNVLSRFTMNDSKAPTADRKTEQVFIHQEDYASNHNGGSLFFGPHDNYLYLSLGDGGGGKYVDQSLNSGFFGAVLRIDVNRKEGNLEPNSNPAVITDNDGKAFYKIPEDNPWAGPDKISFKGKEYDASEIHTEFYAVGFRNPFRWSFYQPNPYDTSSVMLILSDVGSGNENLEEINFVKKGGNYGWRDHEGYTDDPDYESPVYAIPRGKGLYHGNSITGGVVYQGNNTEMSEIAGQYIFADYHSGNVWKMNPLVPNPKDSVEFLFKDYEIVGFGHDPSNGDVLYCDLLDNEVKRIVKVTQDNGFPAKLSETGAFADLSTLKPNPTVIPYEINLAAWSDHAKASRWFTLKSTDDHLKFSKTGNWSFPEGSVYVQHFDLEMERGNPKSSKRIETRFLIRNEEGVYGVSYKWNEEQTDATLIENIGEKINFEIDTDPGPSVSKVQQKWNIPSRAACLTCHTNPAGHILSLNTRQLNNRNQLESLSKGSYLNNFETGNDPLAKHTRMNAKDGNLESRVRSYLDVNCAHCHLPGGTVAGWDARSGISLADMKILNINPIYGNGGDSDIKMVSPGKPEHSAVLQRMKGDKFPIMPPQGTNVLNEEAIEMLTKWVISLPK